MEGARLRGAREEELETEEPKLKTEDEEDVERRDTLEELRPPSIGRRGCWLLASSGNRIVSGLTLCISFILLAIQQLIIGSRI